MDQIEHKFIQVEGLKLHVAEIGTGNSNVVVFLHGFPEIWYTWRYQMIALANAGFRSIAPDYRGYGLSDPPLDTSKVTYTYLINDLLGILDALDIAKVFLVGKDFGALPAYYFAIKHPERTLGVVTLGVPFMSPKLSSSKAPSLKASIFQDGSTNLGSRADFGRFDAKTVVRNVYILFSSSEVPIARENEEVMDLVNPTTPLPPWFTEEDLATYGALYEKSGFLTALKLPYRSMNEDLGIKDPKVEVPALFIMGEKDYVLKFPGIEEYIRSGVMKEYVPKIEIIYIPDGSHFVHEQFLKKLINYCSLSSPTILD